MITKALLLDKGVVQLDNEYLELKNKRRDDFVVEKISSAKKREKGVDLFAYCKSGKYDCLR